MKNLRKKVGVKLITNSEDYLKLVSKLVSKFCFVKDA